MAIPRGIRNNNPGNIRHSDQWKGLTPEQPDPDFCTFSTRLTPSIPTVRYYT